MKYEVGDEVLVKCKVIGDLKYGRYKVTNSSNSKIGCETVRHLFPIFKEIYPVKKEPDMTAEESWDIANRITASTSHGGLNVMELVEIFGTASYGEIFKQNTPSEAKAKIEAWEAEKEIKVGDVVKDCNGKIGVVVSKGTSDNVIFGDGSTWNYTERTLEKTGRHIDIDGLLKQIGGNE